MKRAAAHLEWEGFQELEMALVGTPVSWLVDLMAAMVQRANELAPPSSSAPFPNVERQWAPVLWSRPWREAITQSTTMLVAPKEDEPTLQVAPLPSDLLDAIDGSLGSSTLPIGLQKVPLVPCCITELALPAMAFSHVNLKDSGKIYLCGECAKSTSNQDSILSHYLQEYLRIHLVCPQWGMSYSNPSKFHHHGMELHNLLFH